MIAIHSGLSHVRVKASALSRGAEEELLGPQSSEMGQGTFWVCEEGEREMILWLDHGSTSLI